MSNSLWPHGLQHARLPCPLPSPRVSSNSCPMSWWRHPTISSSVAPFSSCPQSFLASGSFPMSQLFASDGQSTEASASASVLPMNIQGWFPLGLTGLISLLSKGLLRVFSGTTIQCTISNSMHNIYVIDKKNRGLKTKLAIEPDFKVLFFSLKLLHSQNEGHSQKEGHCLCIAFLDDYLI